MIEDDGGERYSRGSSVTRLRRSNVHWILQHAMIPSLLISSGIAYLWPEDWHWDPFVLSSSGLRVLVATTMFCLGLVVKTSELHELRKHPAAVLLGVLVQCTLMPALAAMAILVLNLQGHLAQGVILVGCVPGAMASNVLTMTARGNVSYSVSLTTVATLLSPISVPLALAVVGSLVGQASQLSPAALSPTQQSLVLLVTVVVPVISGYLLKEAFPKVQRNLGWIAPILASVALLWIIASVVAGNRERLQQIPSTLVTALLAINILGYVGGYQTGFWSGLPASMRRALSLEVGMQNAGLGTFLAALLYGLDSAAQIATAAYTFGCMLTGTLVASYWSRLLESKNQSEDH